MDPAGIRELLLLRHYTCCPHPFERAARELPYKVRVYPVYASIPWLPLSERLTQRVSRASEGYAGLLQYDALIIAGIDLESCSERDIQHIRSAVERGLPIIVCGGLFGLGQSYRLWHDLEPVLPARVPAVQPAACADEIIAGGPHPLLDGLPRSFGRPRAVHPVEPASDARVLAAAGGRPILVASERFGGRQLMLAVADSAGMPWAAPDAATFFAHPFHPALVGQCLSWLMGARPPLRFEDLEVDEREADRTVVRVRAAQEVRLTGARCRLVLSAVDEGRLAAGGDCVAGEKVAESVRPIGELAQDERFEIRDPAPGASCGVYDVELRLEVDDPPPQRPAEAFAMAPPPRWSNWKGPAVDVRRFRVRFADRRRSRVFVPGCTSAVRAGDSWSVRVRHPAACEAGFEVTDPSGRSVGAARGAGMAAEHELAWRVPPLTDGDYAVAIRIRMADGSEEQFRRTLRIVAPPDPAAGFQLVGHFATGYSDEEELRGRVDDYLDAYGLDTISIGCMRSAGQMMDPDAEPADEVRRVRRLDAIVAGAGRNLWNDFDSPLSVLATHGASRTYAPTEPCVHAAGYGSAVRARIEPMLRLQEQRAGLISTEIIDEPHLYPSNVCRCDVCLRLYRERFGEEMPRWEDLAGDRTIRRWRFFEWLLDYTTRAFETTARVKRELAPALHLHHTAIDRLHTSDLVFNGMHRWARHGDELYMACYPWSYLNWRGGRELPHSQTHWISAWIRSLATRYDISWGVFMELWEHDVPNRRLPEYWSVGQFYALLAAGAIRLDTFLASFEAEVFGISFERLREFGREVNRIRPFFPLLAPSRRPQARMAFLNPWCQWVMDPQPLELPAGHEGYGYYRRYAFPFDRLYPNENRRMMAYELCTRAFPDLDQVEEQLFGESDERYDAVVVSDCRFLARRTMERIEALVRGGCVLVCDCDPDRDEAGASTGFLARLCRGKAESEGRLVPGLDYATYRAGEGRVVRLSRSIQEAYAEAVEGGRIGIRDRMEEGLRGLLAREGRHPRWSSSCADLDPGLRLLSGTGLVAVANVVPERRSGSVVLRDLPFEADVAVNLTTGEILELWVGRDSVRFDVGLDGYRGALVALFSSQPASLGLRLPAKPVAAGGEVRFEVELVTRDRRAAAGTFCLDVAVVDPDGRTHRALGGPLTATDGQGAIARTMPVNAACGDWTVTVRDPVFGLSAGGGFRVDGRGTP